MKILRVSFLLILAAAFLGTPGLFADPHPHSRPHIDFISEPVTSAQAGVLYTYTAAARSSDSGEIVTYALLHAPTGMTIDSISGLVAWTPAAKGFYPVDILARGDSGHYGRQVFTIRVSGPVGGVRGQIVDAATLQPIKNALVRLFAAGAPSMESFDMHFILPLAGVTDSMGNYTIANIDTGTYFALASKGWGMDWFHSSGDRYDPVWWMNSPTMAGADPILILPDSTVAVDFKLVRNVPPRQISVSGIVTDTSGNPLKNALVVLSKVRTLAPVAVMNEDDDEEGNSHTGFGIDESMWGRIEDACGSARTDSNGAYTIHAFTGFSYIASAYARGFAVQFYNGKANVLEADQLTPSGDTTGINFRLTPLPPAASVISGSVQDSTGKGVVSRLILFPVQKPRTGKLRTVNSDSTGAFTIDKLYDGKYILMAVPFTGYLPAFYKMGAFGVWNWKQADTITLVNEASGLVVGVIQKRNGGAGVVHGRVRSHDGAGIDGAVIYAAAASGGAPLNFTVSLADGSYDLGGLPQANLVVFADKPGYNVLGSASGTINYVSGGTTAVPDIMLDGVTGIGDVNTTAGGLPVRIALAQNYPNPFNPSTHIQYDLPRDARVTLKVFNVIGQEIALLIDENQTAGSHSIEFNAAKLPTGVYFYRLQVDNTVLTRKMILLR